MSDLDQWGIDMTPEEADQFLDAIQEARRGPDLASLPWRTGRRVGRTVYGQLGPEPSDDDPLLGLMDTRELAKRVVQDHNRTEET